MCNTPHSLFGFPDKGNQSIDVALRFLLLYRPVIPLPPPLPQSASPTDFPSSPSTSPHPFLFLPCLPFSSRSLSSLALLLPFHFQIHLKSAFLSVLLAFTSLLLLPPPPPPLPLQIFAVTAPDKFGTFQDALYTVLPPSHSLRLPACVSCAFCVFAWMNVCLITLSALSVAHSPHQLFQAHTARISCRACVGLPQCLGSLCVSKPCVSRLEQQRPKTAFAAFGTNFRLLPPNKAGIRVSAHCERPN